MAVNRERWKILAPALCAMFDSRGEWSWWWNSNDDDDDDESDCYDENGDNDRNINTTVMMDIMMIIQ